MQFRKRLAAIGLAASIAIGGSSALADQALFNELEKEAQSVRELELINPLNVTVVSRDELIKEQEEMSEEELPVDDIADWNHVLTFLGFIEEGDDMMEIYDSFSGDAILGYYDPETKALVIVSTSEDEMNITDKTTFIHETVHALQDQHFDLDAIYFANDDMTDDLHFARLSLIEGDASVAEMIYLVQNDLIDQAIKEQENMDIGDYSKFPFFLVETSLFPYEVGPEFIISLWTDGGWDAVNEAWENPPSTSEQIIHPEKYLDGEGAKPVKIADPLPAFGDDWRLLESNDNGELVTRVFLQNGGATERKATKASEGWGGDRQYIISNDEETASVWATSWDSEEDADEFFDLLADTEVERLGAEREDVDDDTVTFSTDGWYGEIHRDGEDVTYYLAQSEEAMDTMIASQENAEYQPVATPVIDSAPATPVNQIAFWVREN